MIRRVCALAALALVLLQGSSGGHMLMVEHTRCAEHGAWIHGDGGSHRAAGVRRDMEAISLAPCPSPEEGHEHCAMSADRRETASLMANASSVARLDRTPTEVPLERAPFTSQGNRFRIAPKNSPPA